MNAPRWFLALGMSLLVLAGCQKFSNEPGKGTGKVFRYAIVTNPTSLDPGMVQDGDTIDFLQQVYEGLVRWGENNEPVPCLAETWDIEDGGKKFIFHLKNGVKYNNGEVLKAGDFKYAMERNCAKNFASPVAESYLSDIKGVREYIDGKADSIEGISIPDDKTVIIELDKPRPYFLGKLTYLVSAPLPASVSKTEKITDVAHMIGTGPFKVKSFDSNQLVVLVANKEYHDGAPKIEGIERPVVKDAQTRLNKFRNGELDLVQLERQDVDGLKKDPKLAPMLKFFDRPATWYVSFGQIAYPPFKNRDVRRAFAMAIDKKVIVEQYLGNINKIANGVMPPGVFGARESAKCIPFDPKLAKETLAKAGYPGGKGLPKLEMYFREERPDIRIVAEAVASQLKENLGVEVSLRTMEWGAYLDLYNKGQIPFYHMRWAADYLDAENFISFFFRTGGPENKNGFVNADVDKWVAEADSILDENRRKELYALAEDAVLQDGGWVPIYFQRDAELISPRVSGIRDSLFGHLPHTTVALQD